MMMMQMITMQQRLGCSTQVVAITVWSVPANLPSLLTYLWGQHGHKHYHLLFLIVTCPWWNSTRSANLRLLSNLKSAPMSIYHHLHLFYRTQARKRYRFSKKLLMFLLKWVLLGWQSSLGSVLPLTFFLKNTSLTQQLNLQTCYLQNSQINQQICCFHPHFG